MNCCGPTYDLCIEQGATFSRIFTWLLQSCVANGAAPAPVNLTGYSAAMQIRAYPLSGTVLYDATPDLTLGGAAGTITLVIPASDTEDFTWWQGVYDLLLTSSPGVVTRLLSGTATVSPAVTM